MVSKGEMHSSLRKYKVIQGKMAKIVVDISQKRKHEETIHI